MRACTLIGCGPTLEVRLAGEYVPTVFSMWLSGDDEAPINVRCTDGTAEVEPPEANRWTPSCPAGAVALQGYAPRRLTVQVQWSEGETEQSFEPTFTESRPNGPECEPTCRSARVDVQIPQVPAYGDEASWGWYSDAAFGFRIRHPAQLGLETGPRSDQYGIVYIGERIRIRTTWRDPLVCEGECPMIENTESVTIAGRQAQRAQGYIGSIGGNIPQQFLVYVFRRGEDFISFELYGADRNALEGEPAVIVPLRQQDIELLERMLKTLEFTR